MQTPPEGVVPTADAPTRVCCERCGRAICVYEPLIVAEDGRVRETLLADETELSLVGTIYYHRDCYRNL